MLKADNVQKNAFGDVFLSACGASKFQNTPYDLIFQRFLSEQFARKDTLYVITGTDCGLLVKKLLLQEDHGNVYLFLDLPEVIEKIDRNQWANHIHFYDDVSELFSDLLHEDFSYYLYTQKIVLTQAYCVDVSDSASDYVELWERVHKMRTEVVEPIFQSFRTFYYENCRLLNVADNTTPFGVLKDRCKGMGAVLIAGGPTLDESIKWIQQHQSQLVVAAVGRVCRRLNQEGITPDLIFSVDPFDVSFDNSKGIYAFQEQSVLVHSFHVNPKLIGQWHGASFYLGSQFPWAEHKQTDNLETKGPTVTNAALESLLWMGIDHLFLAGVDFCFPGGKTHESKSDEARFSAVSVLDSVDEVVNYQGERVPTEKSFKKSHRNFQASLDTAKSPPRVFSLSDKSAMLEGAEYSKAPPQTASINKSEVRQTLQRLGTVSCEQSRRLLNQNLSVIHNQIQRFEEVAKYAEKAKCLLASLAEKGSGLSKHDHRKLTNNKARIEKKLGRDGDFVFRYNSQFFSPFFTKNHQAQAVDTDQSEAEAALQAFFSGVNAFASTYKQILDDARERLVTKRAELFAKQPLRSLYQFWQDTEEWGRYQNYRSCCSDAVPDSLEDRALLQQAKQYFLAACEDRETQLSSKIAARATHADKVYQRIQTAFDQDDGEALAAIQVDAHQSDASEALKHLVDAAVDDQSFRLTQALAGYQKVDDPLLTLFSLKRQFALLVKLNRPTEALGVLKRLTKFDFSYWISYADLVYAYGKHEDAINVLEHYLQCLPKDIGTRLKVAGWCFRHAYIDRAKAHLGLVLELEPDNPSAAQLMAQCDSPSANQSKL
ncbi:MAG: DUF115 domain-containing protein [Hydrogenovibrio sp.]|uniref:6-hydroxymethylpterin diphosphokinase MptE-like protein n=1 Tax=Hydrogenovibrio sp. TaxID=2065821 RepID=UPI00287012B4|nr:6-hydroxymethylpterin diphosphokinase MptE-like protein [Hydrogenovibrio sp.]MDR9500093.1 DUF115 domain-containing protein [Hydrogenovibrio sp.]